MAVSITSEEEKIESLKALADAVAVAMETAGLVPDLWFGNLEKKRSRALDPSPEQEGRTTNRMRNVGTVALSNVTSQISRLNPIGKLMRGQEKEAPVRFTDLQQEEDRTEQRDFHSFNTQQPQITVTDINLQPSPRPLNRTRKISKSSEAITTNPIDNVLMPFAKLSQGLQTLGSNFDQQLSRSCEQFIGAEVGSPVRQPELRGAPRRMGPTQFTNIDDRVRRGDTGCSSLILNI